MKRLVLVMVMALARIPLAWGQTEEAKSPLEQEIRALEMRDAEAVLRGDFGIMESSWAEDFSVNSPNNQVTQGKEAILKLMRAGDIGTYSAFVREIESVTIHADVAIVMGLETVERTSRAAATRESVQRRYMNVWTRREGRWLLTARQANVLCEK